MMRWCIVIVIALIISAGAARAQPPTKTRTASPTVNTPLSTATVPTATATPTRTVTFTGTPLAGARVPVELIKWPTPGIEGAALPQCVLVLRNDVLLPMCVPLDVDFTVLGATKGVCVSTGLLGPATLSTDLCVTWPTPYASASEYSVWGSIRDASTSMAALLLHHITTQTASTACAQVFNQDAANARIGKLCLYGYPQATPTPPIVVPPIVVANTPTETP